MNDADTIYKAALHINRLRARARLGVGEEERRTPQDVLISLTLHLAVLPSGAERDDGDYHCYHTLSEAIHAQCVARSYRLIEFLGMEVYRLARRHLPETIKLTVRLDKPVIGLPYVEGGASFTYSDLPRGHG